MTSAVEIFDDRPDKRAHTTAGIVTAAFLTLLLLLLWLIKIYTPIPPIPPDPQVISIELYDGPKVGGTNQVMGGGSEGNTGKPGSQNNDPTDANSNPTQTGAITNPNSNSNVHSDAQPTPNAQPSVSSETQALLDKLKNKKNNTAVNMNGGQGSGPYNSGGVGDGNGPGVGPGDGGIPGDGGNGGKGKTIRIQFSPDVSNPTQEEGAVAVRVSVDRSGKVTKAEAVSGGSTTGNPILKSTATQSAYKVIFNSDDDRPEIVQCVITFNFTLTK